MTPDELAIRNLVQTWFSATQANDLPTVLNLMTDDVIFMVPGRPPFGKTEFAAASANMSNYRFEGASDIQELQIIGDFAYIRNHLKIKVTPVRVKGPVVRRSGYTLTLLRKCPDGQWRIFRDANLVTTEKAQ